LTQGLRLTFPTRLPLFLQLLALVMLSLVAALAINTAIVFYLPPPPPEIFPLGEVADALRADGASVRASNERIFQAEIRNEPPHYARGHAGFRETVLNRSLADALHLPIAKVRVVLLRRPPPPAVRHLTRTGDPASPRALQFDGPLPPRGSLPSFQERFVNAPFEAAVQTRDGKWLTLRVPEGGFVTDWQKRVMLWFAISAVLLIPIVYLFARRLASPITAFARAAERLGRDPNAPLVALKGPAEVGVAAMAFNEMQERLRRYVQDRTAMIGAVAHDLRTPLTRLRFRIESAPEPLRLKMAGDIDQMEAMIAATMAFVRDATDPVERRKLELVSLVESVADEMAETGLDVVSESTGTVVIEGDPVGLRRLVTNLMDNAVKFAGSARARVSEENGLAVVEIDDDGPGIAEDEHDRLFEPFQRSEPSRSRETGGVGLGLAVVRSVARAHGGDAWLTNRAGGGLRARAELPI
jgi:signal transduction histidine kinase